MAQEGLKMAPDSSDIALKTIKNHVVNQYFCSWTVLIRELPFSTALFRFWAASWPQEVARWPKMNETWRQDGLRWP